MHEAKKPVWLDVLMFAAALGLLAWSVTWSQSYVFSAMTFGMLVVCGNAAVVRQLERRRRA